MYHHCHLNEGKIGSLETEFEPSYSLGVFLYSRLPASGEQGSMHTRRQFSPPLLVRTPLLMMSVSYQALHLPVDYKTHTRPIMSDQHPTWK